MSVRDTITAYAEKQYPVYRQLALEIHAHPEVSNYEFFACEHLSEQMKKEGFQVTVDVPGHRTGFTGVYKAAKPGPVLVFLAHPWGKNPGADGAGSDRRSRVASADQGGSRESRQRTVKKVRFLYPIINKVFLSLPSAEAFFDPPGRSGGIFLTEKGFSQAFMPG